MLFPLAKLIQDRPPLLCIGSDKTVADALELMIQHDYSQLPIIDKSGLLVGVVSEESIIRTLFHTAGAVPLLKVPVDNCQTRAVTLPIESDLFEALDRLK